MTEAERLLEAIGELDGAAVYAAAGPVRIRRSRPAIWTAAAALGAAAVLCAALIGRGGPEGLTREQISDAGELSELYGGELLVNSLTWAGVGTDHILVERRAGADIADVSGWSALSCTLELGGGAELRCRFDGAAQAPEDAEIIDYNGVKIGLAREEDGRPRASFTLGGVDYELTVGLSERGELFAYLDILLSAPSEPGGVSAAGFRPFETLLGREDYSVSVEQLDAGSYRWHFWLDGGCVAECVGGFRRIPAWSADLDGDGVSELVTVNARSDGAVRAYVYRASEAGVTVGVTDPELYRELGFDMSVSPALLAAESFDPETLTFTAENYGSAGELTRGTFSGIGSFLFTPSRSHGPGEGGEIVTQTRPAGGLEALEAPEKWESAPELTFGGWTFTVEETPAENPNFPRGVQSRLVAADGAGNTVALTEPFYANFSNYRLFTFTDILGFDGVALQYAAGAASAPALLYRADGDGPALLARCGGRVYTCDLDGDGIRELLWSTSGAFPFTYVCWLDRQGAVAFACLDDAVKTAQNLDGRPVLTLREGNLIAAARWTDADGATASTEVDLTEVFRALKA